MILNLTHRRRAGRKVGNTGGVFQAGFAARELPVDGGAVAVHLAIPSFGFPLQIAQRRHAALAEALAAEQTDLDFGLIQPASAFGHVMYREPVPQPRADLFSEPYPLS